MEQIDRHIFALQRLRGLARAQRLRAEAIYGDAADGHQPGELRHGVGAIVPNGGVRLACADAARILVGDVAQGRLGLRRLSDRVAVAVEPVDGEAVPGADADAIGVAQVDLVRGEFHPRWRVVHD